MNDRIKAIRAALKLTQAEFGKRLGLSQNYIWMIERGDRTPSDRTLMDLCREFSVNEVWLREGVGPMFVERSRRDDLFDYARRILGGGLSDTEAAVLAVMAETTPEEWELFAAKVRAIVDGLDAKKEQADP
mgnify:FL=1